MESPARWHKHTYIWGRKAPATTSHFKPLQRRFPSIVSGAFPLTGSTARKSPIPSTWNTTMGPRRSTLSQPSVMQRTFSRRTPRASEVPEMRNVDGTLHVRPVGLDDARQNCRAGRRECRPMVVVVVVKGRGEKGNIVRCSRCSTVLFYPIRYSDVQTLRFLADDDGDVWLVGWWYLSPFSVAPRKRPWT